MKAQAERGILHSRKAWGIALVSMMAAGCAGETVLTSNDDASQGETRSLSNDNSDDESSSTEDVLAVSTDTLQFEDVAIGADAQLLLNVENIGAETLTLVLEITDDPEHVFALGDEVPNPLELESNDQVTVSVLFTPRDAGMSTATLRMTPTDSRIDPISVSLSGEGRADEPDADGDGASASLDCDDANPDVHPGADEICDDLDNDCNGLIDDGLPAVNSYADEDGDGFGVLPSLAQGCALMPGTVDNADDCDDLDATVHPGSPETCDGTDNDCDGSVDEDAEDASLWYPDADGDGYGTADTPVSACSAPANSAPNPGDCDDAAPDTHPGADEHCDGVDNDCDNAVDEDLFHDFFLDEDGDGFGQDDHVLEACDEPEGYCPEPGDCDDHDPDIHPDAPELCDQLDNDCDGAIDEAISLVAYYLDDDGDGYGLDASLDESCDPPDGSVPVGGDCADDAAWIHPGAPDIPDNGIDEDCTGADAATPDLDGDEIADLVIVNHRDDAGYAVDSVILYGGTIDTPETRSDALPTLGAVKACVADFENDGHPDVFFVNRFDGNTYALDSLLFLGSGTFSNQSYLSFPTRGGSDCVVGDFNTDGAVDLAVTNSGDGDGEVVDSYIYFNDGQGLSRNMRSELDTLGATALVSADLNGDLRSDLIVSNYQVNGDYTQPTQIFLASASGFSDDPDITLPSSGALRRATVADLNLDGFPDVVVNNYYDGSTHQVDLAIYFGPEFSENDRTFLPAEGNLGTVVLDANGDDYPDLAVLNGEPEDGFSAAYLYYGAEGGFSTGNRVIVEGGYGGAIAAADMDGDGYDDLLIGMASPDGLFTQSRIYYGGPNGLELDDPEHLESWNTSSAALADLDGDGRMDVVLGSFSAESYETQGFVHWNSARGFEDAARTTIPTHGARKILSVDVNADGVLDLVIANEYESDGATFETESIVRLGSRDRAGWHTQIEFPTQGAADVCAGDLNGDGRIDLVFANSHNDADQREIDSYIYLGGDDGFDMSPLTLPTSSAQTCELADLDRDGDLDIVFANFRDDAGQYLIDSYVYWNSGGTFSSMMRTALETSGSKAVVAVDLTDDAYPDLVFSNFTEGDQHSAGITVYPNTQGSFDESSAVRLAGCRVRGPVAAADLNADGRMDLVVPCECSFDTASSSCNQEAQSIIYWGATTGFSEQNRDDLPTDGIRRAAVADLDGDGALDVILAGKQKAEGGEDFVARIFWNDGSGIDVSYYTEMISGTVESIGVADVTGDGMADVILGNAYENSYKTESRVYSLADRSPALVASLPGMYVRSIVVDDFDEDGHPDIGLADYYDGSSYDTESYLYWGGTRGYASSGYALVDNSGTLDLRAPGAR